MDKVNTFEKIGREKLKELLAQLPDEWVAMFNRMYRSVDVIPLEKINWAIQQCERSLEKINNTQKNNNL